MEAALGVVECVGGLDPSVSSLYLTLYQVCIAISFTPRKSDL